jgi:hypothetical protein
MGAMTTTTATADRVVFRREDGCWVEKRVDARRAGHIFSTQGEAIEAAKRTLLRGKGGELTVMGEDGRIRSKDTYPRSRDPRSIKDREH